MRAGDLDTRVTFLAPERSTDSAGVTATTWKEVGKAWASVRHLRATERFQAASQRPIEAASIWIRYRSVDPKWRVQFDGKTYSIVGVAPVGSRREGLELALESYEDD